MNAVVTHFQVRQAGTGFFPRFQIDQELPGVLAQGLQVIKFAVIAGFQHAAVTDNRRRVVDDGFFQQRGQFRVGAGGRGQLNDVWRFQFSHRHLQLRQRTERVSQAGEVAGAGVAQADPRQNPLDVANLLELRLQLFESIGIKQAGDGRLACQQHLEIAKRTV